MVASDWGFIEGAHGVYARVNVDALVGLASEDSRLWRLSGLRLYYQVKGYHTISGLRHRILRQCSKTIDIELYVHVEDLYVRRSEIELYLSNTDPVENGMTDVTYLLTNKTEQPKKHRCADKWQKMAEDQWEHTRQIIRIFTD